MKTLSMLAVGAAAAAWVLWGLRPSRYQHFVEVSYDQPYLVFAFESLVALATAAVLLLVVVAIQRDLREQLVPWSANGLVRVQLIVISSAAVSGIYGLRQIVQMKSMLQGSWGTGDDFWLGASPVIAVALSPWVVFFAAAVVSSVAARLTRPMSAAILLFDLVATAYLAFVFANLGHWACVTCSGPAM